MDHTSSKAQQAKKELQEKTRLNQILLDALPCVALLLQPDRTIVASNETARKVGAVPGEKCYESWVKNEQTCSWCLGPKALETGEPQHLVVELTDIIWDAYWLPVSRDLYLHYAFEITEQKLVQKELRESEEKYRILIEQAIDGILIVQDGMIKFANRRLAETNGRTVEELLNTNFLDYVRPDEVPRVANRYRRRLAGDDVEQVYETVLLHKDGHEIPVEVSAGAITYQGSPAVFAFVRDHTERKRAEEALRKSEEKLRAIIEASPLSMMTIQSDGIVTLWNPAAESLFGWSEDEILGKYIPIVPKERQEEHRNLRRRTFQRGEAFTGLEVVRQKKDGTLIDVALSTAPIYDAEGNVESVMGLVEDISERKRTEEELRKAHDRLVRLNETLKQEIEERKQIEQELRKREAELEIQTSELEEVNTALRVLLKRRDEDKAEIEEKIVFNVNELVLPYIERLRRSGMDAKQTAYVNILESNLNNIVSPVIHKLSSKFLGLTPTEIQIANLVKEGKTTKEIAEILHSSPRTVEFHRNNIRKKMGIKNSKANLRSHLLSM
jgi:PAS domain S-box-containing protein